MSAAHARHWLFPFESEIYVVAKGDIAHRKALGQLDAQDYTLSDALDVVHEFLRQRASDEDAPERQSLPPPAHGTPRKGKIPTSRMDDASEGKK